METVVRSFIKGMVYCVIITVKACILSRPHAFLLAQDGQPISIRKNFTIKKKTLLEMSITIMDFMTKNPHLNIDLWISILLVDG